MRPLQAEHASSALATRYLHDAIGNFLLRSVIGILGPDIFATATTDVC